jgi:small subunit ribosomal protein S1
MNEKFVDLYKNKLIDPNIYPGALITGEVTDINNKFVTINAFLKSDGYIPISQFKDEDGNIEVEIGSKIEVIIDMLEDLYGDIRLSREKAKKFRAWEKLEKIFESNDIISGNIIAKVKGGFTVKLDSIRAFLPGSLIGFKSSIDPNDIKGKDFKFKIIKLEKKKNNIVVSQRFFEERNRKKLKTLLDTLNEYGTVMGTVKNITDYGVFIDLGGLDGLLHITDMSWKRIKHPSNLVKIGDEIKVKVLKFDKKSNRVSLGLKQLSDDPWKNIRSKYREGLSVKGIVTNITDYGCFVEIDEGIEGLVHLSEMDWTNKNINPNKVVKQGMELLVSILDINIERKRISLGLKQCTDNPWISFFEKYKNGDIVSGKIKTITDFGIFIELLGGIDGLIHFHDIDWKNIKGKIFKKYKKGQEIKAVLLKMNFERERIYLGIKQMDTDIFFNYTEINLLGNNIDCILMRKLDRGFLVKIDEDIEGILKINKFINKFIDNKKFLCIKNIIINVDRKNRYLILINKYEFKSILTINKNLFKAF